MVADEEARTVQSHLAGILPGKFHQVGNAVEGRILGHEQDDRVSGKVGQRFKGADAVLGILLDDGLSDEVGQVVDGHGQAVTAAAVHEPVPARQAAGTGLVEDDDGLAEVFFGRHGTDTGLHIRL